jgi:hypothetical protein
LLLPFTVALTCVHDGSAKKQLKKLKALKRAHDIRLRQNQVKCVC